MVVSGIGNVQAAVGKQTVGTLHTVGIGKPEVYIAVHAQTGNGVEAVERIALEYGTADAGRLEPGEYFLTGGLIEAVLMEHGMVIAEPLQAYLGRRLAIFGQTQQALGYQGGDSLLLAEEQKGIPLSGIDIMEQGRIGLTVPKTAAQQLEQSRQFVGIGVLGFHHDGNIKKRPAEEKRKNSCSRASHINLVQNNGFLQITGLAHVAFLGKGLMHAEGILQRERDMARAVLGELEIIPEKLLVIGMGAVLDDAGGALTR